MSCLSKAEYLFFSMAGWEVVHKEFCRIQGAVSSQKRTGARPKLGWGLEENPPCVLVAWPAWGSGAKRPVLKQSIHTLTGSQSGSRAAAIFAFHLFHVLW